MVALGKLYIGATPIGNLDDVTRRFHQVASQVDGILCEDTRHSKKLFSHLCIRQRLQPYHQHNEVAMLTKVIARLLKGEQWMLVSDAGTPMIQDPGYKLVRECHRQGIEVSMIPGACSVIAALCLSGQPTDNFQFIGYLPNKHSKRKETLSHCITLTHSVICYLSTHRVISEMQDVLSVYGNLRQMSLVKEITKINETVIIGNAEKILAWLSASAMHTKGEFVLIIEGWQAPPLQQQQIDFVPNELSRRCVAELRQHMPLKKAIKITAKITSEPSKQLYRFFTLTDESTRKS